MEVARIIKADILPVLGSRALSQTTRADWVGLVNTKKAKAQAMAALIYRVVSAFTNYAEAAGWIEQAPLPRRGSAVLAPPPRARDRVLSDDELTRVWQAAGTLNARGRALVRLLVLTGARRNEVAGLHPGEIDVPPAARETGAAWKLPSHRAKNGKGYTIPLCPLALSELSACNYHPLTAGFSKLKLQLDAASGVTGWVLHDLRRTVRTGLSKLGIAREISEAAINHIGSRAGLVATYDKHDYAGEVLAALSAWQDHVARLVA
jgi:integrase